MALKMDGMANVLYFDISHTGTLYSEEAPRLACKLCSKPAHTEFKFITNNDLSSFGSQPYFTLIRMPLMGLE